MAEITADNIINALKHVKTIEPTKLEDIEKLNVEMYEKYGTGVSNIPRHICTKCHKAVSIDGSMSNKGHRLICNSCVYRVFGSVSRAFEWIEGCEEDG